ncbi:hypothetical protein [Nonomuraea guangzhouensis]|uniref:Uncharacterized protein n=1 Tax=Nonomuraea guangzhouensis TaxID=1291555 RepID=A0ABW4GRX0_9ACTN|nr:hypothetical protein [Nonomuraea guangzhouensis]
MTGTGSLEELREREYLYRSEVNALRRQIYTGPVAGRSATLLGELARREEELGGLAAQRARAALRLDDELRGPASTGLDVDVQLRMTHVPTAICHLFDPARQPFVSVRVVNAEGDAIRRVRVTSYIEGYSARAVDTVELDCAEEVTIGQFPTLFSDRVRTITEMTAATLNVLVEDLDGRAEFHTTRVLRLLARTTAPLAVIDPSTQLEIDLSRYLGAFVTPNAGEVMSFLRDVAAVHPSRRLEGYQSGMEQVEPQVRAMFTALKQAGINYVNSVITCSPDDGGTRQRVRLPRESLTDRQANCVDATVLMASLLEAMSLSPAIVVVPGHALLAWETWRRSDEWRYLETTEIGSATFEEACNAGELLVRQYREPDEAATDLYRLRRWPLRRLRATGITPME